MTRQGAALAHGPDAYHSSKARAIGPESRAVTEGVRNWKYRFVSSLRRNSVGGQYTMCANDSRSVSYWHVMSTREAIAESSPLAQIHV